MVKPTFGPRTEGLAKKLIALNLFVIIAATYLVTASGYTLSDAGQSRVAVARALVERGDVSVPADIGIMGRDGRYYSWFGIGPALAALPFYVVGKATGADPAFVTSLLDQLAGAITVVLVFLFCTCLGFSNKSSLITALFYGLGTMAWPYAKNPTDHALETLFVLLSVYFMYRHRHERHISHLVLSAFSFGFALLIRPTSILAAPALAILLIHPLHTRADARRSLKQCLLYAILMVPCFALMLWYDYLRFGSVFETGYGLVAARLGVDYFSGTPFTTGLLGFLVSPGKGFFYYSPVVVLFFLAVRPFSRKFPVISLSFMVIVLSTLVLYSKFIYWHGCNGWGPRYLLVTTPYLIIQLAVIFDSPLWRGKPMLRKTVYLLFALSLIVQAGAITVSPYKYFVYLQTEKKVVFNVAESPGVPPIIEPPAETYFDWHLSPVLAQFTFMGRMAAQMKDYRYHEPPAEASYREQILAQPWMNVFDFWWLYEYLLEGKVTGLMVALLLLILIIASGYRLLCLARE